MSLQVFSKALSVKIFHLQFDFWRGIVFIASTRESYFSLDQQSPRDDAFIKILIPVTILGLRHNVFKRLRFQSEAATHGKTIVTCRSSQTSNDYVT